MKNVYCNSYSLYLPQPSLLSIQLVKAKSKHDTLEVTFKVKTSKSYMLRMDIDALSKLFTN